jgi:CheY-like chemotaxis protein/signal transduction histidine kinase
MTFVRRTVRWAREASRRKVWVSVGAYLLLAVTIMELSAFVFEAFLLPEWGSRLVTMLLILGFPVVVVLAWIFDVTPDGVRRTALDTGDAGEAATDAGLAPRGRASGRPGPSAPRVRRISHSRAGATATPSRSATIPPADDNAPAAPPDPERVKQAALGHVRHELKTPINAILGYSEMLLEDLADEEDPPAELMGDLERIRQAGRSLLAVVDGVLDPARIERSSEDLDLDEAGAQIRADLRNPVSAVVGYAELLMENSVEAGREHLVPDLERIGDAGRRLLELSTDIVKVATSHMDEVGGRLSEASAITEGVLTRARKGGHSVAEEGMGSLLVVDDNAMNRDLLSRQLARAGYVVQTAEDGRQALEHLSERAYDLILLDVIMPGMDGIEVLRHVKSDAALAGTPVVMLSSLDDVESAIRCIELGAADFLSKPFHPTLLQARIGATLELTRMEERIEHERVRLGESEAFAARLLRGAFPASIATRVRGGESGIVESYEDTTVLWCDVEAAARRQTRDPAVVAARLQRILEALEDACEEHGLEARAQVGDGMALAGGIPTPTEDHADRIAAAALTIQAGLSSASGFDAPVRVGLGSGSVTGAVLGGEGMGYRLWGDAVDLARSLGESAHSGRIMVSPGAFRSLNGRWSFATPGVQEVPGRGQMKTYVLEGPA